MKVKDFLKILAEMPPEAEVVTLDEGATLRPIKTITSAHGMKATTFDPFYVPAEKGKEGSVPIVRLSTHK